MFNFPKDMLIQPVNFGCDFEDNEGNVIVRRVADIQDKELPVVAVPIDQFDGEDFNINDFGHIRNDISALARASSQQEYDMLLKRLSVLNAKGQYPKDVTPQGAISRIRSRYLQSPCELDEFARQLASVDMSKLDEAYRKSLESVPASVPESESVVESK